MTIAGLELRTFVAERLVARNPLSRALFDREAHRLARACEQMSSRFLRGGRLLAFGRGAAATDAQHVSVEFVHPVIVGKRALPALDISSAFTDWLPAIVRDVDIAMGFAGPHGDAEVDAVLNLASSRGAQTFALPGRRGDFAIDAPSPDPLVAQELIEILYHTLWETVHVFFEHGAASGPASTLTASPSELESGLGATAFLYPFLSGGTTDQSAVVDQVASSIRTKAEADERLREDVARRQSDQIASAVGAILGRVDSGATLLMFGNGGSATDANDWALDCIGAPAGVAPIPAVSLSMEPANLTAIANDVGSEVMFVRQLIAHGRSGDVAIAISTSGGSSNVLATLREARKRGMLTVALLGYDGGEIVRQGLADFPIVVGCDYIPRIQEVQASIYHVMTETLRSLRGA